MKNNTNIVEVKNLSKKYGKISAVDGISFEVKNGEVFGMLGPNGAGKTTTVEIIEGIRRPDKGETFINKLNTIVDNKKISKNFKMSELNGSELPVYDIEYNQKKPFEKISNKSNKYIFECFNLASELANKKKILGPRDLVL